jgi:long-chain acyl-CoA synthetase
MKPYIGSSLEEHRSLHPNKTAIISDNTTYTYEQFYQIVEGLQKKMIAYSDISERRVGIFVEEPALFLALFFSIIRNGWSAVPLDAKWTNDEMNHALGVARPAFVIVENAESFFYDVKTISLSNLNKMEVQVGKHEPSIVECDSNFYIGFTSGSTGKPKGFFRNHQSWIDSFTVCEQVFPIHKNSIIFSPGPLFHSLSLFAAVHALHLGATIHVSNSFSSRLVVERIARQDVDTLIAVPTMVEAITDLYKNAGQLPSHLQTFIVSGSGWSRQSKQKTKALFPTAKLFEYYGASELSFVMHKEYSAEEEKGYTVFPGVSLTILDDSGKKVSRGEVGKVYLASSMLFSGYLNNERETKNVLTKNGATVGDLGYQDEKGYIYLVGRESNMIKSGGLKVFPEEVEEVLQSHRDIEQAFVFSILDNYWGEKVVAAVIWKNETNTVLDGELKDFCKKYLASFKVPKQFIQTNKLEFTKSGKIDRRATKYRLEILV